MKIENRENNQNNEKHEMILIIFHEQGSGFRSTKPLEGLDFQQIDLVFCSNSKSSFMKERKSFLMVTQMMIVKVNKQKIFFNKPN